MHNADFTIQLIPTRKPLMVKRGLLKRAVTVATALSLAGTLAHASDAALATATGPMTSAVSTLPSFADIAERVTPAVVNVQVTSQSARRMAIPGHRELPEDMPIPEQFRHFFEERAQTQPRRVQGQGSGFLVDSAGYVVTNHHVIEGSEQVMIVLDDGSEHQAEIVGVDEKTDLALLRITVDRPLPYVELGESATARVGDWILAVGNPFGLGGSVNAGIISARGRDIRSGPYDDYLQIDAAINRGNSGGPLFDTSGRVIGVNTAIYSPTGSSVGIGFAIPADTVRQVVTELRENGRVERGWLGIQIQAVTPALASGLGLAGTEGALVADVIAGAPASGADLRAGDVILTVEGQRLESYKDLPRIVAATKAGTSIDLEIMRDAQPRQVTLKVGQMPGDETQVALADNVEQDSDQPRLGLYLAALTPELRLRAGLSAEQTGALVARVEPGSLAAKAGIKAGSLVSMVGAEPIDSPDQLVAAVRGAFEAEQQTLILRVEREGRTRFVAVPLT